MTMPTKDSVGSAPPPLLAVLTNLALGLIGFLCLPSLQEIDTIVNTGNVFRDRLFPDQVSVTALICIRSLYAIVCFYVPIAAYMVGNIIVEPTYLPDSKLRHTKIVVRGIKVLFPFTAWCWNLLGLHFALSAYITRQLDTGVAVPTWLLRFTFMIWETAAPLTLLVSAVVKYAIWPIALKRGKDTAVLKTHRALLQHNANVFMAFSELALLGGLPIHMHHASLPLLLGVSYVFFTWAIRNVWSPSTGPAFIYFFMDTTRGAMAATSALLVLTTVMTFFHFIFCAVADYAERYSSGLVHVGLVVSVFAFAARFRD